MSRIALTDSAGNAASISSNGALVIAGTTAIAGSNVTSSAVEVWNRGIPTTFTPSISTGTIRNAAGILYGYLGTTAGTVNFKVSGSEIGPLTVSAGVLVMLTHPFKFTSLTASASAAVYTVFLT